MAEKQIRVCLFLRVSTTKQDYDRQLTELQSYCGQRKFVISRLIANNISGTKESRKRTDLKELMESAKVGEFDKLVITEISRLGRNAKELMQVINFLHQHKVSIILKNLGVESLDENGEETFVTNLIISFHAEQAQEEKRQLSNRIKSGLVHARTKGRKLGRPDGKEDKESFLKKYPTLVRDIKAGISIRKNMKLHDVSKCTVIKAKRLCLTLI